VYEHEHNDEHGRKYKHSHDDSAGHEHKGHDTNPGPYKYIISLLDEHSKHLDKNNEHHDRKVRAGATYIMTMTLGNTDQTSRIAFIDFVRGRNKNGSKNLPADFADDWPYKKAYTLTIVNRTGGADINYNINRGVTGTTLNGLIKTGTERTFDSLYPVYENLNLARASGTSTAVVELILIT